MIVQRSAYYFIGRTIVLTNDGEKNGDVRKTSSALCFQRPYAFLPLKWQSQHSFHHFQWRARGKNEHNPAFHWTWQLIKLKKYCHLNFIVINELMQQKKEQFTDIVIELRRFIHGPAHVREWHLRATKQQTMQIFIHTHAEWLYCRETFHIYSTTHRHRHHTSLPLQIRSEQKLDNFSSEGACDSLIHSCNVRSVHGIQLFLLRHVHLPVFCHSSVFVFR